MSAQGRTIDVNGTAYSVEIDEKGPKLIAPALPGETMGRDYRLASDDASMLSDGRGPGWELWIMGFGAYGDTRLLVVASGIESALEDAAEWLAEHAPGHLSDLADEYREALDEARDELGPDAEPEEIEARAREIAETDMTYTESGWLPSWEWTGGEASDELTEAFRLAVTVPVHWVAGNGSIGCLYDGGPDVYETKEQAIESLLFRFDSLGKGSLARMRRDLEADGIHYFDRRIRPFAGADYCEISECDCQDWNHLESEEG